MRRFLFAFIVLQLLGCTSAPTTIQRYTLHSMSPDANPSPFELAGGIGVGPIELPESWRQREVIVWGEANQVIANSRHLWAGDPKLALSRVLATDLSQQLQFNDVWAHPWDSRARPQQQILLVVESLGGRLGGEVELRVKWRLTTDYGAKVVATERRQFSVAAADKSYAAYVTAINRLVDELAAALERSVRENFQ